MNSLAEEIKKEFPFWNSLSEEEKEVVYGIAMQIPSCCEDVARIFLIQCDADRQKTIRYLFTEYGYMVD